MSDAKPRLSLRPAGSHRGAVDGGWWPRETTAEELAVLEHTVPDGRVRPDPWSVESRWLS